MSPFSDCRECGFILDTWLEDCFMSGTSRCLFTFIALFPDLVWCFLFLCCVRPDKFAQILKQYWHWYLIANHLARSGVFVFPDSRVPLADCCDLNFIMFCWGLVFCCDFSSKAKETLLFFPCSFTVTFPETAIFSVHSSLRAVTDLSHTL